MKERKVQVSVGLPLSAVETIDKLSESQSRSRASIVREAVTRYLEQILGGTLSNSRAR